MKDNNQLYAAIDLGANSFHMLVVQNVAGKPRTVAKVKRKVRLASGLDSNNKLELAAMQRGWQCLSLFAERIEHIPKENIKVVSTATLRLATNASEFCATANHILGIDIDIISGEKEAALIYHGMAVTSDSADKRLIIDIGGASTELILGQASTPLVLNSLHMGCVTWRDRYFSDGLLNSHNFEQAINAAAEVFKETQGDYLAHQWQLSLGASGSVQAVQEVLIAQRLNEEITLEKLRLIQQQTMACVSQDKLDVDGLIDDRKPVFASGLAILIMLFEQLNIDVMMASGGALREGLIDQLLKTPLVTDIRQDCCLHLQQRFDVDLKQADQVTEVALALFNQLESQHGFSAQDKEMLRYAAQLHEIGCSIEYLQANKHGAYLLSHIAMAGFSKQQQKIISALVGNYKNEINDDRLRQQAWCSVEGALLLMSCLRLAVIICGRYQADRLAALNIKLSYQASTLIITHQTQQPLFVAELALETQLNNMLSIG